MSARVSLSSMNVASDNVRGVAAPIMAALAEGMAGSAMPYGGDPVTAEVEARLDPDRFVRIHRSTIVNTDHLKEVFLHRRGEYVIVMDDGSHLKASRSYGERIRELVDTVG